MELTEEKFVLVVLSDVPFMDSAGLGAFQLAGSSSS